MPAITVKNIPDPLYKKLKRSAAENRRSMNSEIIHCLESVLESRRIDADVFLREVEEIQKELHIPLVTDEFLQAAKEEGRP